MSPNQCFKLTILVILFFIVCQINAAKFQTTPNTRSFFNFSVIHGRNSSSGASDSDYSSYFCIIDILAYPNRTYNKEYVPLSNVMSHNLCNSQSLTSAIEIHGNGYYVFNLSNCNVEDQINNFERHFPQSSGLIFSTGCDINLNTYFNFSSEYINRKKFQISVITDSKVEHLLSFSEVQEFAPDKSKNSAIACMVVIFLIACFCVIVGAWWSGRVRHQFFAVSQSKSQRNALVRKESGESKSEKYNSNQEAYADLTISSVVVAVVVTIVVLVSLYFFYKYIVYLFITIFMVFSGVSCFACFYSILKSLLPRSITDLSFTKSPFLCLKSLSFHYFYIPVIPIAIGLPILWFCIRHKSADAWILQDLLCVCFCVFQLRTLRLPSFKITFMLLSALFVYDIFFVFITPFFTSSGVSIMEYVATGGVSNKGGSISEYRCPASENVEVLPLSIRTPRNVFGRDPRFTDDFCISGVYSLLGLGDIIIPGILVSYCNAYDLIRNVPYRAYFVTSSIGYALGLVLSYVALIVMKIPQPALLYLVPTCTISVILVALIRKEFRQFWIGPEETIPEPFITEDTSSAVETSSLKS